MSTSKSYALIIYIYIKKLNQTSMHSSFPLLCVLLLFSFGSLPVLSFGRKKERKKQKQKTS